MENIAKICFQILVHLFGRAIFVYHGFQFAEVNCQRNQDVYLWKDFTWIVGYALGLHIKYTCFLDLVAFINKL